MSLGVVIKGPEGIVLAADSRVTLEAQRAGGPPLPVNFDNATKLLSFSRPANQVGPHNFVGAVTYGMAVIGLRTAHSYIPEFEQKVLAGQEERLSVEGYAQQLSNFYKDRWEESMPKDYAGPPMTFIVGGYDKDAAYGRVFLFQIPGETELTEQQPGDTNFGMTWGGQLEIASRLVHGFDPALTSIIGKELNLDNKQVEKLYGALRKQLQFPIPYKVLPLQDCVDLAVFLIRTTMVAQRLAIGVRGVGGPIDVAVVTRTEGLGYIQQKVIHGEEYA
ncbi:MAG: hypothetical protein ACFFCO_11295 [Promethearchaeota archaeon]